MSPGAAVMMIDPIASVQNCIQSSNTWKKWGLCGLAVAKILLKALYSCGKYGSTKLHHAELTHTHTHIYTICPGQDKRALGCGWHQHSKSDTIYHWPLSMETFITSWQENLVENNNLGFDNNLAFSCSLQLGSVQFWLGIICDFYLFILRWFCHVLMCFNDSIKTCTSH